MSDKTLEPLVFADTDSGGTIHVTNIKGGVGKSTVATNLADVLSKRGSTVLIDLDVQGSATHALCREQQFGRSSWELFSTRYAVEPVDDRDARNPVERAFALARDLESRLLPQVVGRGEVTSLAVRVGPRLDLIPAGLDLYKQVRFHHLRNLIYNLGLCRGYYKYIVLDTPSVWNGLTRALVINSDLNLIPVTLNALSTRSLRDYLSNVKKLAQREPGVRIRIVKNEVFGTKDSKIRGKTRTMNENRCFLESLCEQVRVRNEVGISLLPQSIMFDMEIPESAIVRSAQDEGKSVRDYKRYSSAARAFEELARLVQYVLNNSTVKRLRGPLAQLRDHYTVASKLLAAAVLLAMFLWRVPASNSAAPRPIAPQQLIEQKKEDLLEHEFGAGESVFRIAKYAICRFRAVVPSSRQVNLYVNETIEIHNRTRMPGEPIVGNGTHIPAGTVLRFYPPAGIENRRQDLLCPVYDFFVSTTNDSFGYVTGDWCERGTGGGTPHYGIDVAATLGSDILSPLGGIAVRRDSRNAGRIVGVVRDGMVLFFAHMDKRYFNTGDIVKKGDAVGTVGMTGVTNGPHVHIGYGLATPAASGTAFGKCRYKLTDPKLFFYREQYVRNAG